MTHPLARILPFSRAPRGSARVRSAGAVDEGDVGVSLRGPVPAGGVFVNGRLVSPETLPSGEIFVSLPAFERSLLELRGFASTQAAQITLKAGPPRVLSVASIPTTSVFGGGTRVFGDGRVELLDLLEGAEVSVDGAVVQEAPSSIYRSASPGGWRIRTVVVPQGRHSVTVSRGSAVGPMRTGTVDVTLEPGEMLDLAPDDFPVLDSGVAPSTRPPVGDVVEIDRLPYDVTGGGDKVTDSPDKTDPPKRTKAPQVTEAPFYSGSIEVLSSTPGVSARFDGAVVVATAPLRLDLGPGEHTVEVSAPGFETRTVRITVGPSEALTFRADLVPVGGHTVTSSAPTDSSKPARRLSRGWMAVIALAVVGTVGVAVAVATRPAPPPPPAPKPARKLPQPSRSDEEDEPSNPR